MRFQIKKLVAAGLIFLSSLFNSVSANYCAKCHKIESERAAEQSHPNYQKNEYYDDYKKSSSLDSSADDSNQKDQNLKDNQEVKNVPLSYQFQGSTQWLAALDTPEFNKVASSFKASPLNKGSLSSSPQPLADSTSSRLAESTVADILTIRNFMDVFENSFTILVPSDEAIKHFPSASFNKILEPENRELLFAYITNHVIPNQILRQDFDKPFKTLGGRVVEISSTEHGLVVNSNAKVLKSLPLGNKGILYIIDKVLIPIHD